MSRRVAFLLIIFSLVACEKSVQKSSPVLTDGPPESGGFSPTRLARLDSGMSDWVKKKWINGSVALIARKGKIVFYKAYGYNDPETKEPLDKNGIFRIASQTKAITTVAAMILWEEGKFSIDDPVSKFIPSFANQGVLNTFNPKDTTNSSAPLNKAMAAFHCLAAPNATTRTPRRTRTNPPLPHSNGLTSSKYRRSSQRMSAALKRSAQGKCTS